MFRTPESVSEYLSLNNRITYSISDMCKNYSYNLYKYFLEFKHTRECEVNLIDCSVSKNCTQCSPTLYILLYLCLLEPSLTFSTFLMTLNLMTCVYAIWCLNPFLYVSGSSCDIESDPYRHVLMTHVAMKRDKWLRVIWSHTEYPICLGSEAQLHKQTLSILNKCKLCIASWCVSHSLYYRLLNGKVAT